MAKAASAAPTVASDIESNAKSQLDSIAGRLKEAIKNRRQPASSASSRQRAHGRSQPAVVQISYMYELVARRDV
eukprot:COSAG01_NODE_12789_length_1685_cov_6.198613_1_plen_74_part_00